jgi:hypothetical protein
MPCRVREPRIMLTSLYVIGFAVHAALLKRVCSARVVWVDPYGIGSAVEGSTWLLLRGCAARQCGEHYHPALGLSIADKPTSDLLCCQRGFLE